jgi:YEATS domain-containing protein 4
MALRVGIVYGNVATPLARTAGSAHTHAWRLFLRGARGSDLTPLLARVVFKLHESFPSPSRGRQSSLLIRQKGEKEKERNRERERR